MKTLKSFLAVFGLVTAFAFGVSAQTTLTGLDGAKVDVEAQNGKVVILAIGASWLPLSGEQAVDANALAKKYAGRNVAVYFVATDSLTPNSKNFASNDDIKKFVAAKKLTVPVLRDADGAATLSKFEVDQLPSFVILDKNGRKVGEAIGGSDPKFDLTAPISKVVDGLL
jgi:thiol-disulfide isomerase/thioredoxin